MKSTWHEFFLDNLTLPNLLSAFRLLLTPVFILLFLRVQTPAQYYYTVTLAAILALSDLADGWIARRYHQVTDLGKFLDPLSDKLLQAALLFCLGTRYPPRLGTGRRVCAQGRRARARRTAAPPSDRPQAGRRQMVGQVLDCAFVRRPFPAARLPTPVARRRAGDAIPMHGRALGLRCAIRTVVSPPLAPLIFPSKNAGFSHPAFFICPVLGILVHHPAQDRHLPFAHSRRIAIPFHIFMHDILYKQPCGKFPAFLASIWLVSLFSYYPTFFE